MQYYIHKHRTLATASAHHNTNGNTSGEVSTDHRDQFAPSRLVMFLHRPTSSTADDVRSFSIQPSQRGPTEWERSSWRSSTRLSRRRDANHARAPFTARTACSIIATYLLTKEEKGSMLLHKTYTHLHVQLFIIIIIDRHRVSVQSFAFDYKKQSSHTQE